MYDDNVFAGLSDRKSGIQTDELDDKQPPIPPTKTPSWHRFVNELDSLEGQEATTASPCSSEAEDGDGSPADRVARAMGKMKASVDDRPLAGETTEK